MLFTTEGEDTKNVKLIAPDRDYQDISEALIKVKEYLK
jgi:hypothetical protein